MKKRERPSAILRPTAPDPKPHPSTRHAQYFPGVPHIVQRQAGPCPMREASPSAGHRRTRWQTTHTHTTRPACLLTSPLHHTPGHAETRWNRPDTPRHPRHQRIQILGQRRNGRHQKNEYQNFKTLPYLPISTPLHHLPIHTPSPFFSNLKQSHFLKKCLYIPKFFFVYWTHLSVLFTNDRPFDLATLNLPNTPLLRRP